MSEIDLKTKWKTEMEHHDHSFKGRNTGVLDPVEFYKTRPYGMKKLIERVGDCRGKHLLDIGGGLGVSSSYFVKRGAKVSLLDISSESLKTIDLSTGIHKVLGVGEQLPFKSGSFDIIWGAAVLHHLHIPSAAEEIRRILRPGGRCFFYEPLGANAVVNLYRKMTPHRRTPTEKPLSLEELRPFQEVFPHVSLEFFHLLALVPQGVAVTAGAVKLPGKSIYHHINWTEKWLAKGDSVLFRAVPPLRTWAQVVVMTCDPK